MRFEGVDELPVLLRGFAGHAHDDRAVVTEPGQGRSEGLESRVLEAVAVHESRPRRRRHANQVRLRMARPRTDRDALGRHGAEAERHRPSEDPDVVVHRGQDEGPRQADAPEIHGEPRVVDRQGPERRDRAAPGTASGRGAPPWPREPGRAGHRRRRDTADRRGEGASGPTKDTMAWSAPQRRRRRSGAMDSLRLVADLMPGRLARGRRVPASVWDALYLRAASYARLSTGTLAGRPQLPTRDAASGRRRDAPRSACRARGQGPSSWESDPSSELSSRGGRLGAEREDRCQGCGRYDVRRPEALDISLPQGSLGAR